MNSIANMTNPKTPSSREAMIIASAITSSGMTKAAIAKKLDVDASFVSHWATGHRPVPAQYARPLAQLLGLQPEEVSPAYAEVGATLPAPIEPGDHQLRPDLEVARLQNDIHALNLALGALVVAMVRHRPTEAKDVAASMRKAIPKKFRDRGLVRELLTTLDQA